MACFLNEHVWFRNTQRIGATNTEYLKYISETSRVDGEAHFTYLENNNT